MLLIGQGMADERLGCSCFPGQSKTGVKYKGTVEVPNLSDENDMEDLDVSVAEEPVWG